MRSKILTIATALTLLFASPAVAHDALVDIKPAAGEVLSSTTFEAVLTFNNPLLVIDGQTNAELATKLESETDWVAHPITVDGTTLVAKIDLPATGTYDLRWSVVSSDGHPITGESSFVIEAETALGGSEEVITTEEPEAIAYSEAVSDEAPEGIPPGFYVGLLMVALGAVFAPIGLMMRRKSKKS
jgi:methionine-rich copper-binding protein CopC